MAQEWLIQEWRKQQEPSAYPFADQALMENEEGDVVVRGFLLDAILFPIGGTPPYYLSEAIIEAEQITIVIGDTLTSELCSGTYSSLDPGSVVELFDSAQRPAGALVSEPQRLRLIQPWGAGSHLFTVEQTEFAAGVCLPTPEEGVRGFSLPNGDTVNGDVWLIGSDGIVLRGADDSIPLTLGDLTKERRAIRVDAVGDPLFRRRLCVPESLFVTPRFITSIEIVNGLQTYTVTPDEFGNVQISIGDDDIGDPVLRLTTTPAGTTVYLAGKRDVQQ